MKWWLSEVALAMKQWQSQTFEMILPSWWCNSPYLKNGNISEIVFLIGGQSMEAGQWDHYRTAPIRNWKTRNLEKHQRYYLKTLFIQAMFAQHECVSSPTPWFLFRLFQTHLGAANTLNELLIPLSSLGLSALCKGTSVVANNEIRVWMHLQKITIIFCYLLAAGFSGAFCSVASSNPDWPLLNSSFTATFQV